MGQAGLKDNEAISLQALQEFEDLVRLWSFEGDNREILEEGGLPDLRRLAEAVLLWASQHIAADAQDASVPRKRVLTADEEKDNKAPATRRP